MAVVRLKLLLWGALACSLALLAGCGEDIDDIREQGELIILTRNAPTTYYEGREGLEGPEYELAAAFAAHMGVEPKFVVLDTVAEILEAISEGRGHVAAAGLTITEEREKSFEFGPPYKEIRQGTRLPYRRPPSQDGGRSRGRAHRGHCQEQLSGNPGAVVP